MFDNNSQNSSPVMEMFQLIAINEFKGFEGVDNEIIILSDMIQNTSEMSMYQNILVLKCPCAEKSVWAKRSLAEMSGAEISPSQHIPFSIVHNVKP